MIVFNTTDEIFQFVMTCIIVLFLFGYTTFQLLRALIVSHWRTWHIRVWDVFLYLLLVSGYVAINALVYREVYEGFLSHYLAYAIHGGLLVQLILLQTHLFRSLKKLRMNE